MISDRISTMPITLSAKKSLRKAVKNRKQNRLLRQEVKKVMKGFGEKQGKEGLEKVYSAIDKAVKAGIFHRNKASRLKARFGRQAVKVAGKVQEKKVLAEKKTEKKPVTRKAVKKTVRKAPEMAKK